MKQKGSSSQPVTAPRPTRSAAVLVAVGLSIPVFVGLTLLDWIF